MENLPAKQQKLILALISHNTVEAAYREMKVSRSTCYRWLQDPEFAGALERARVSLVREGLSMLRNATGKACQTLIALLDAESGHLRLKAAEVLLKTILRVREANQLEDRLDTLERVVLERRTYRN